MAMGKAEPNWLANTGTSNPACTTAAGPARATALGETESALTLILNGSPSG